MATAGAPLSETIIASSLVDPKSGRLSAVGVQWVQTVGRILNNAFNQQSQLTSEIVVEGLPASLTALLANIDANGVLTANGIDFTRAYKNKTIANIPDAGPNFPLAGGAAAYLALVTSGPDPGQMLQWNGAAWVPVTLAAGGVTQIIAGTNVTITPVGGTGAVTVNAPGAATGYLKGTVTINFTATSGTFTANATIAGAAVNQAAFIADPNASFAISPATPLFQQKGAYVSSPNTVACTATIAGFASAPGNVTFPVVVFQ
jgi:hypothetical protein